jgi:hypothetical protein
MFFGASATDGAAAMNFAPGWAVTLQRYRPVSGWMFGAMCDRFFAGKSLDAVVIGAEVGYLIRLVPRRAYLYAKAGAAYGKARQQATLATGGTVEVTSFGAHVVDAVGLKLAFADFFTVNLEGGYPFVFGYSDWPTGVSTSYGAPSVAGTPEFSTLRLGVPQFRIGAGLRF